MKRSPRRFAILALLALGLMAGAASAQTLNATALLTVQAPLQTATVLMTPSALTISEGSTATFTVTVSGTGSTGPTGSVALYVKGPGTTDVYTLTNSFPLVSGSVSCTYPVPATAPMGGYYVQAVYSGDANYLGGVAP